MRSHGVPWGCMLKNHPLHTILTKAKSTGIVSDFYKFLVQSSHKTLPVEQLWKTELRDYSDWDWNYIWSNLSLSSRNPNHQMIHYKIIHRAYLYPRRLHQMKLKDNQYCDFCPDNTIGTFFHMVWQCPEVFQFWENVAKILPNITGRAIPCTPRLLLLDDTSKLNMTINNRRIFFAGFTAAKKMIVCRWKSVQPLTVREWLLSYRDIIQLELSAAWIHGAKTENISCWSNLLSTVMWD